MGKQHVIELNGKRYDALTGKMIAATPLATAGSKHKKAPVAVASIDGFAKPSNRNANHAAAHKTEKSKTLMRTTVSQPQTAKRTETVSKQIVHTTSIPDQKRLAHAKTIQKSPTISRFSASNVAAVPKASHQTAPKTAHGQKATAAAATASVSATSSIISKALAEAEPQDTTKLKKERRTSKLARKLHISPRQVSFGGFVIAAILIGGFIAYQNSSNISMRLASSKAGIKASLPSYHPSGFGIAGGIKASPGQVTINYKSASDARNFTVTQNVSDWNSQALLDNYVAASHPNNQTIQDRGKTVYMYDGSNATWVDGGVWFRIEGDSQLSSDQVLNIAASL